MKTTRIIILSVLLALPLLGFPQKEADTQALLMRYFASSLSGGASEAAASLSALPAKAIPVKNVGENQKRVWAAWQKANAQNEEEKLATITALRDSVPSHWLLPAALEPDARMNYYWGSKGEVPQRGYPLYLYLHGSGPREMEWQYGRLWALRFQDAPSAYFIPQIPHEGEWYRWWQKSKQWAWEKMLRLALCGGGIDPWCIYVIGISEGGYGSQRLASFYADYLAGAGPMAGGEPLKNAPAENCSSLAFSFLTGEQDMGFYRNKLTGYTRAAFDSLRSLYATQWADTAAFTHRIELIPNHGHQIDYTLTTPWLKQYTRRPWPKHFIWEDYPMDGRHRTGFYNLRVERMPAAENDTVDESERRVRYEVNIEGNTVSLSVNQVYYTCTEKDPYWGIELKFTRAYKPASTGRVRLFLNEHLVDLNKPVKVVVNGREVFSARLKPDLKNMALSCSTFFDPLRLFPASVEIDLAQAGK